jgi:hypothetical protein
MKIEYRNQLPGKEPKGFQIDGWVANVIGVLIGIGILIVLAFLLPFLIAGILGFIALIILLLVAGWIYLGFKIGWRDLWDVTRLIFSIFFGRGSWATRSERINKEWEDRVKGKNGVWVK